jgi:hypothetical protein
MAWILYVIVAILLIAIIKRVFPSPGKLSIATNALLAEHVLTMVELVPENPFTGRLKNTIVDVWRSGSGFSSMTEESIVERFNSEPRIVQLNFVAMALNELGHEPLLPNEPWHSVVNPFIPVNDSHVAAVRRRLQAAHGVDLNIASLPLKMTKDGIFEQR